MKTDCLQFLAKSRGQLETRQGYEYEEQWNLGELLCSGSIKGRLTDHITSEDYVKQTVIGESQITEDDISVIGTTTQKFESTNEDDEDKRPSLTEQIALQWSPILSVFYTIRYVYVDYYINSKR